MKFTIDDLIATSHSLFNMIPDDIEVLLNELVLQEATQKEIKKAQHDQREYGEDLTIAAVNILHNNES